MCFLFENTLQCHAKINKKKKNVSFTGRIQRVLEDQPEAAIHSDVNNSLHSKGYGL